VKSPTASHHHTLYADAAVALRRGLMLTAERYENAGVLNDATDARILSLTGASAGFTRFTTVYTRLQRQEGAVLDGPHC